MIRTLAIALACTAVWSVWLMAAQDSANEDAHPAVLPGEQREAAAIAAQDEATSTETDGGASPGGVEAAEETPRTSANDLRPPVHVARVEPLVASDAMQSLSESVTIYRDQWGVPHIDGPTDRSVVFGMAYAQAEDFFWQVEDNYILALGKYSEVHGGRGLNSDLLNHAYRIVERSQQDFAGFDDETRGLCEAFAAGLNYYLLKHPEAKPRLITRFEPWQVLAFHRQVMLELCFRYTRLSNNVLPRSNPTIWAATGSNAWALGGQRTATGEVMIMANPHLPWFGMAQLYEAHMHSDEGLNITGGTIYGSPILSIGHNEDLGWTLTTNEPDVADLWRERFDDPEHPLRYRYGDGYKTATQWTDTIGIKSGETIVEKPFTFTRTDHGPVVAREDDGGQLTARISGLFDTVPLAQGIKMAKAHNLSEFRDALAMLQMPMMNVIYGDREGNIYYVYGAKAPRRDPSFDWSKPVDGSDPRTEWQGFLTLDELPQALNPPSGYLQNCNSSPYTSTVEGNPVAANYEPYLVEDAHDDTRRAKRSRQMLGEMRDETFADFQAAVFDTEVYWAKSQFPNYEREFEALRENNPVLAARIEPYWNLLREWDGRISLDSTQATLCEAWFEMLYGSDYPGEELLAKYAGDPAAQLGALVDAADRLKRMHGDWKIPYGDIHRIQRLPYQAELLDLRFDDQAPSLSSIAGHGPMGVVFTQYYTPSLYIPLIVSQRKKYGVVGATYLAAWAFGPDGVRGASLVHFGESGDPESPHYFDQAQLLSETRLKPILFDWNDVLASAVASYHPGEPVALPSAAP